MRTVRKLVVAGFLALVLGATCGFILDSVQTQPKAHPLVAPLRGFMPQRSAVPRSSEQERFAAKEIDCLANIVFREARNQSVGIQELTAIVVIARRDDPDPQWPKTICGIMEQPRQISGVNDVIDLSVRDLLTLGLVRDRVEAIYKGAWKTQLLPQGWECVRYWRVSDKALKKATRKHLRQLGIKKSRKGLAFFDKLVPVATPPGDVTFFRDPERCKKQLPTT